MTEKHKQTHRDEYDSPWKELIDEYFRAFTKMRYVTIAERIGMEKGMEKGKIETAKNMLKMGLDKKMICQATGLTEKEIDVLKLKAKPRQQKS